jgi:hypothetical protein
MIEGEPDEWDVLVVRPIAAGCGRLVVPASGRGAIV